MKSGNLSFDDVSEVLASANEERLAKWTASLRAEWGRLAKAVGEAEKLGGLKLSKDGLKVAGGKVELVGPVSLQARVLVAAVALLASMGGKPVEGLLVDDLAVGEAWQNANSGE